jgi:hypothetical protein
MHSIPLIFLWFIYLNVSNNYKNYEIIPADNEILNTLIWAVDLLLTESRAINNELDVILHGFMLQIIYTTVFLS